MTPFVRAVLLLAALAAQTPAQVASVFGRVVDRASGQPVANAQVTLLDAERVVVSDSAGRYEFTRVPIGVARFAVRAVGFSPQTFVIELVTGQRAERPILLEIVARELAAVDVNAAAVSYRLRDFERRKQTGRGQFLTEEEITRMGAFSVADAVKNMRGVIYECGGGAGCYVRMSRAPMRCLPEYVVDDRVMNDFGPRTPIRDIVGIEVYNGPAEVPGEYAGRNAGCGIVVIWTRSGQVQSP